MIETAKVLMGFDQATKQSIEVAHFENGTIITSPKASKLFEEISFNTKEAIEQTIPNTGEIKITNEFIDYYCSCETRQTGAISAEA